MRKAALTSWTRQPAISLLQLHQLARAQHQSQRYGCDHHFTQRSHNEWPQSLLFHLFKIDAQANAGERQQESPSGEIRQAVHLVFVKDAQACQ